MILAWCWHDLARFAFILHAFLDSLVVPVVVGRGREGEERVVVNGFFIGDV